MDSVAGAKFDESGTHRYQLWRIWNSSKPLVLFIMLNPSTADASKNDPTVRRLIRFAMDHGYGGFYVGNLFSYISPYPTDLLHLNPLDYQCSANDKILADMAEKTKDVVFAWGNNAAIGWFKDRNDAIVKKFPNALCFELSSIGMPKHPLYLSSTCQLKSYSELISYHKKQK